MGVTEYFPEDCFFGESVYCTWDVNWRSVSCVEMNLRIQIRMLNLTSSWLVIRYESFQRCSYLGRSEYSPC